MPSLADYYLGTARAVSSSSDRPSLTHRNPRAGPVDVGRMRRDLHLLQRRDRVRLRSVDHGGRAAEGRRALTSRPHPPVPRASHATSVHGGAAETVATGTLFRYAPRWKVGARSSRGRVPPERTLQVDYYL